MTFNHHWLRDAVMEAKSKFFFFGSISLSLTLFSQAFAKVSSSAAKVIRKH